MLCGGELEGNQDEWARWRVPASAVQRVCRNHEPSYDPGVPPKDGAESHVAADEAGVGDAAPSVRSDDSPPWKLPSGVVLPSDEETTQEIGEATVGDSTVSYPRTTGSDS